MSKSIGIVSVILAFGLMFGSSFVPGPGPDDTTGPPVTQDVVHTTFSTYDKLWRKHATDTAARLEAGDLKTEKETWDFLAAGQEPARRIAFDALAAKEQEYLKQAGVWTPEVHAKLLRSYSGD